MTITKDKKKEIIENICKDLKDQNGLFFVNFKGVKGNDFKELRGNLKKCGAKMLVARKTLVKLAFEKEKIDFDPLLLGGEVGFVFSFEDGVRTAKAVGKFDKEEKVAILGGIYEGKALTPEEVKEIATLPSKEELYSQLLGTLSAPVSGFMQVLQGNTRNLLTVLSKAKG